MKGHWRIVSVLVLGILLASCGTSGGGGTPTPSATPGQLTANFRAVGQELEGTIQQLQQEFQGLLPQVGLSSQGLQPLVQKIDPLTYLQQPFPSFQSLLGNILPQAYLRDLPRGQVQCPNGGSCTLAGSSDDLEIRYQKGSAWNKLLVDWNYSTKGAASPTVYLHQPYDQQGQYLEEMPTKAFARLDLGENGSNEGEATFQAQWRSSTCLIGKYLFEPERLSLQGFINRPAGTGRLVDLQDLSLNTSATKLSFGWNLNLLTQGNDSALHTEGLLQVNGSSTPGMCGSLLEKFNASSGEVDVKLDTQNHTARLYFKITDVDENTGVITIQSGYLTLDRQTVTFTGVLNDQNRNCVPGENLTLTFASGQTMSLEQYLIQHMEASTCNNR
ncbi:hypothetical protein [Meiothermus cerbereus]|uniref:hypothetical protein n=1 Tax=Meiothermus cerbereus TaxID=65552 RepID=UPI0004814A6A|nr:hypothetical protein [Meiothermus cerbereus]